MLPTGQPQEGFQRLQEYTGYLRRLAQTPREAFVCDFIRLGSAKYYLLVAIEACLDLAQYLIARHGWRTPRSYADAFVVLAEHGVVPGDFLPVLRRMAAFRNRLVHLYWDVEAEVIYRVLQEDLDDFDRYATLLSAAFGQPG